MPIPEFQTSYVVVIAKFHDLRWEVIVHCVDIDEIVEHHCLNFIFILDSESHN